MSERGLLTRALVGQRGYHTCNNASPTRPPKHGAATVVL
jgi:hypothetical protein